MMNGAQFMYTFGEATGTFEFGDPKYPDMKGAIIVKKGETLWVATLPRIHHRRNKFFISPDNF